MLLSSYINQKHQNVKIILVGEVIKYRSFNGANKALPVLASSLYNAGFTNIIQLDLEHPKNSIKDVLDASADAHIIIFAGCMTPQWQEIDEHTKQVFDHLHNLGRYDVPILVGGYATKGVEDIAKITPWITAFCDGEGEESIVKIAQAVAEGNFYAKMPDLPGLCFVDKDGKFHYSQTHATPRITNFDDIDQNFGLIHIPKIHDMDIFKTQNGKQLKTAQIFTQRGCPWGCAFCNKSTESNFVIRLSEASFRKQLQDLKQRGYEAVYLDVDTFTIHPQAAKKEAEILKQEGFIWGSNTRIDQINYEQMRYFVEHNCVYMFFGVEHTLPEVTLAIRKFNGSFSSQIKQAQAYPHKVKQTFQQMHQAGLPSSYFLILGLPKVKINLEKTAIYGYEPTTWEDDMQAIKFGIQECNPDYLNFNLLRFMPGSSAADIRGKSAFTCIRPSGEEPITAGYFLPRVAEYYGYHVPENHGVYRLCESVARNQPTTTVMTPERVYATIHSTMELINAKIDGGGKPTKLFIDRDLLAMGLVTRDNQGRYAIAPLKDFLLI